MRTKFFETNSFKKLQRQWYAKLDQSGFDDKEEGPDRPLRRNIITFDQELFQYFSVVSQYVMSEDFESQRDRLIMEGVADGLKIKQILVELDKKGLACHRQTVRFVIRRFELKWNIRTWQKNQLTSNQATA